MKPDMELALPARAENIAIVRHALGGLGEVFEISDEKLSDIRLAVTEACSNVVMHAYPEPHAHPERQANPEPHTHAEPHAHPERQANPEPHAHPERQANPEPHAHPQPHAHPERGDGRRGWGMMEVAATMVGDELAVVVRDWGEGIRPRPDSPGLGLGLSLIAALAETVQLGHDTAEHTEVRMTFSLSGEQPVEASQEGRAGAIASAGASIASTSSGGASIVSASSKDESADDGQA